MKFGRVYPADVDVEVKIDRSNRGSMLMLETLARFLAVVERKLFLLATDAFPFGASFAVRVADFELPPPRA